MLSLFEYLKEMADTSRALSTETKFGEHMKKHGLIDPENKTAGFSSKGIDVPLRHPATKAPIGVEVKDSAKGAKLVSFALKWHEDKKRWDIPDDKRKSKPLAAAELDKATITLKNGTKVRLLDHINKTYKRPRVGKHLGSIRSDLTDMTPVTAHNKDKGISILHIQDKGTFRIGEDIHGTGLPPPNGMGQWIVASERSRTEKNQKDGTGMQINFRPVAKSIEKSPIDMSTDEGAIIVKQNMLRSQVPNDTGVSHPNFNAMMDHRRAVDDAVAAQNQAIAKQEKRAKVAALAPSLISKVKKTRTR